MTLEEKLALNKLEVKNPICEELLEKLRNGICRSPNVVLGIIDLINEGYLRE